MYNDYFSFKEAPFSIAPDPRYLFMTPQHREALAHLVYGLNSEGGCILLTGEVGTGKTTVCRCLLNQIPDKANIALVLNPKVSALELLASICDELKISYQADASIKHFIDNINQFLIESHARGEKTVLIIDEAQNLEKPVLEQLRLLTNLETDQRKLLQIIILGQPELIDILSSDEMRQLAQRITARFHLKPLTREDIKAYINHRLAVAGSNVQLFSDASIKKLFSLSKGIPRLINILCDRALLGTYVQNKHHVDTATLEQAAKEVFGEIKNVTQQKKPTSWPVFSAIAASIVITSTIAVFYFFDLHKNQTPDVAITNADTGTQAVIEADNKEGELQLTDNKIATLPQTGNTHTKTSKEIPQTQTESINNDISVELTDANNDAETHLPPLNEALMDIGDNKGPAYSALFNMWGQDYIAAEHGAACNRAKTIGLSCLFKQGNLTSLQRINRPAVLKLYDTQGNHVFVAITQLNERKATLNTGKNTIQVSATELDKYWLGEYTLLWRKPPYYKNALTPGNNGPMVQWLDQQMVRLYGHSKAPTINDTYTDDLISQVKKFQLSKGLIPDGVAGPITFILLNTELGHDSPMLDTTQDS